MDLVAPNRFFLILGGLGWSFSHGTPMVRAPWLGNTPNRVEKIVRLRRSCIACSGSLPSYDQTRCATRTPQHAIANLNSSCWQICHSHWGRWWHWWTNKPEANWTSVGTVSVWSSFWTCSQGACNASAVFGRCRGSPVLQFVKPTTSVHLQYDSD